MSSWKDLKIKSKLLIGFGIVISLLIVITITSYSGLISTIQLNGEVVQNNEKTILMLEREIDHLKWVHDLEDLFINEKVNKVTVQTDYRLCALGKWLYGDKIKEFVNGDQELEKLVETIKQPHQHLHESAIEIQSTYKSFDLSLETLLFNIWIKHLNWVKELNQALVSGVPFTGITNPRECLFGKWYYSFKAQDEQFSRLLKSWETPHERMHQAAVNINLELRKGNNQNARRLYNQEIIPVLNELEGHFDRTMEWIQLSKANQNAAREIFQTKTIPSLKDVQGDFLKIRQRANIISNLANTKMENGLIVALTAIALVTILAIIGGIISALKITRGITRPIIELKEFAEQVSIGDLSRTINIDQKDEVGLLGNSMNQMVSDLNTMVEVTEKIADGDLTIEVNERSEKDALGLALKKMVSQLSSLIQQISSSSSEVASGSEQLASASQSMSQGATEQAASVEEISSSMTEISTQIKQNAENGEQASLLANETRDEAEISNRQMSQMISAMSKITSSSKDISKIIKVIDEIAFQINLLSLNAAVEAARAGTHGKGFAVVADEVRNLATRSAKAANEITEMITISVKQVEDGTVIVDKTADSLQGIVKSVEKITDIVAEIAMASKEQAIGINQITQGLEQIDRVTQQNSAHAEESASSSEELSSQAMILRELIDRFQLKQNKSIILSS
ncbi:CZB domain-containing protein [bacterium]|nr:CZB domain-containing protein [bacterium]